MTYAEGPGSFDAVERNYGQPIDIKPALGDPGEFPLDALPETLAKAIRAIVDVVQIPAAVAANSILGACSLICQGRIMVEMPTREIVPPSLFLVTIASSGDRKTSADKLALQSIRDHERELRRDHHRATQNFSIDKAAYDAQIAEAKRGRKSRAEREQAMREVGEPPNPPATPAILVEDFTIEGLTKLLDEGYPITGLFSDEGARVLGGYSMQEGRSASTGAALSQMWDGKPIKRVRSGEVVKILENRRVAVHLMLQPGVASKFFADREMRDQGLMSRLLIAYPRSLKGHRLWREPDEGSWDAIADYHSRLTGLTQQVFNRIHPETRDLELATVKLQPDARAMWIAFSDHLERQQCADGPLSEVSDIASKMAQHALRIAAVLSYFSRGEKLIEEGISARSMGAGIELAQYYLAEAMRMFDMGTVSADSDNAQLLIEFIRKEGLTVVGRRWLSRNAPKPVRPAEVLARALLLLVEHAHLIENKGGGPFEARGEHFKERQTYTVIYPEDAP